jgi:hypothetical protein
VVLLMLVLLVVVTSNYQTSNQALVVVLLVVSIPQLSVKQPAIQLKPMLPGLNMVLKCAVLVSTSIPTHKSFDDKHQVVFKLIHKTSKFDFFNHHLCHLQVLSSSKKCVHLNHLHHHHFAFVNKLHLFLNHLHLFFVNDHHNHPHRKHLKPSFADSLLWLFHLDQ